MTDHKDAGAKAFDALMEIIQRGKDTQNGVFIDASAEFQENIRAEAHALLDAYLDHMSDAARIVRASIDDQLDADRLIAEGVKRLQKD